jgi:hypothetical protein
MIKHSLCSAKQMNRLVPLTGALIAASWAWAGVVGAEEPATWDQANVASIAAKLPDVTEKLYTAVYQQGQTSMMPGAAGGGDAYHEFKDKVRLMHSESMHLAKALEKGEGRDATKHAFQRISELNRDAAEAGREQFTSNPVVGDFAAVEDLIRQLNPYYGL